MQRDLLGNKRQHHSEIQRKKGCMENPSCPETWSFIGVTRAACEPCITSRGENAA